MLLSKQDFYSRPDCRQNSLAVGSKSQSLVSHYSAIGDLSSPNRAMQVCDAMYFSNPRCESRDFRALDWTKASDLCSAKCVAENRLCDAMLFPAICALTTEIHCDVDHDASITAIAMPRCGELSWRYYFVRRPLLRDRLQRQAFPATPPL